MFITIFLESQKFMNDLFLLGLFGMPIVYLGMHIEVGFRLYRYSKNKNDTVIKNKLFYVLQYVLLALAYIVLLDAFVYAIVELSGSGEFSGLFLPYFGSMPFLCYIGSWIFRFLALERKK